MTIPILENLTPDDIKAPELVEKNTRVTLRINNEPTVRKCSGEPEDADVEQGECRAYLLVFAEIISAPDDKFCGQDVAEMIMLPSSHWLEYYLNTPKKDGSIRTQDEAEKSAKRHIHEYATWLDKTIKVASNEADTTLYVGVEFEAIVGLRQDDEYGDSNEIVRLL
jgi:hypothetical protein